MSAIIMANSVVSNGLLLYLDSANLNSYIGSGTSWNNISGYNYGAVLSNGPTFSYTNVGTLTFDGVDDSFTTSAFKTVTSGSNVNNDTTNEIWYKWNGINQVKVITAVGNLSLAGYLGFIINNGAGSAGNLVTVIYGGQYFSAIDTGTTSVTLVSGVWTQLVITKTSSICKFYKNGVFLGSTTKSQSNYTTTSPYVSSTFAGGLGVCKLYNRALSDVEILQNYNALRARFGL